MFGLKDIEKEQNGKGLSFIVWLKYKPRRKNEQKIKLKN